MKSRRVATFAEEGKWTSGADSTMLVGNWQAWVDGEGHWKVRGPDPDNEAHYAGGDVELTEAEYTEAGNSEARRKIRAARAKKAARAYIQSMTRGSNPQHATRKKSPAQLDREIADVLAKDYRVRVRVEGAPKTVHISPWMTHAQAEHAAKNHKAMIRDRGWTQVVEIEDKSGAVTRLPTATTSHSTARLATWRSSPDIRDATKKGDRLDNFGQIWRVIRVTRNKITAARELADPRDPEKVVLVDQRDFHPRDIAHMRPV